MNDAISHKITKLQARLRAREGKAGLEKNCEAIRREIASLSHRLEISKLTTIQDSRKSQAVASETSEG